MLLWKGGERNILEDIFNAVVSIESITQKVLKCVILPLVSGVYGDKTW